MRCVCGFGGWGSDRDSEMAGMIYLHTIREYQLINARVRCCVASVQLRGVP
jgi:hypothetical protein